MESSMGGTKAVTGPRSLTPISWSECPWPAISSPLAIAR
jgi:hypothetical protein